jgi:glycosyltransferase involved in cell wall biosynthesis
MWLNYYVVKGHEYMEKRVILVGPNQQVVGGVATHIALLSKILAENQWKVIIYEMKDYSNRNIIIKKVNDLIKIFRFKKFIEHNKSDVIHFNPSIYYGSIFKLFLSIINLKHDNIIIQFHGGSFKKLNLFRIKLVKKIIGLVFRKSKKIIFLSNKQKNEFVELWSEYYEKTVVIPNFIKIPDIRLNPTIDDKLKIIFLGRLIEEKGIFDIVEAAKLLKDQSVEFLIVGSGPEEEKLLKIIKQNNINNKVKFLGAKFGREKEKILREADLFILPSSWDEGIPYSILEAMSYGLGILCTKNGGLIDIIQDGYNGLFINKDKKSISETIQFLIDNKSVVYTLKKNAYEYVKENLSDIKAIESFNKVYLD